MSEVHVISENDLQQYRLSGRRIRAICPFHNGHTRTLSIAPWFSDMDEDDAKLAGFGHCHNANCAVTVLVKEWNPRAANRLLGGQHQFENMRPRITASTEQMEEADAYQRDELAALNKLYHRMQLQLQHNRARAYLAQRGIHDDAMLNLVATLGCAYIPALSEWNGNVAIQREDNSIVKVSLKKWADRLIFPFTTSAGERGFLGRALFLWTPGMDENEHKKLIDAHNESMDAKHGEYAYKHQVRRWEKTYRSGFFNASEMSRHEHITVCEGPFDALPLIYAGVPGVVAIAGTHIDVKAIPVTVFSLTMAFDADTRKHEKVLASKLETLFHNGITPTFCAPPDDGKGGDWSERYRLHGLDGLAPLLPTTTIQTSIVDDDPPEASQDDEVALCSVCGYEAEMYSAYGKPYCFACYGKQQERQGTIEGYANAVASVASVFGTCAIYHDAPDYTLEDRVREIIADREAERERQEQSTRERSAATRAKRLEKVG